MGGKTFLRFLLVVLSFLMVIGLATQSAQATPSFWWYDVWFHRSFLDATYPSSFEQTRIYGAGLIKDMAGSPNDYYVHLTSSMPLNVFIVYSQWPLFSGLYYEYTGSLTMAQKPTTFDPAPWDGIQYTFELVDKATQSIIYDTESYTPPGGKFAELGFATPTFVGNSTVNWDPVTPHAGGDVRYRLRLQNIAGDGYPGIGFVFDSGEFTGTSFTFTDPSLASGYYAVRLEAREYFDNNLFQMVNRSVYFTQHEITPVPVPATLLLIGSGLVGLAGLRKKYKK